MPRSQMLRAVALATLIGTVADLFGNHLFNRAINAFDPEIQNVPAVKAEAETAKKDFFIKTPKQILCLAVLNVLRYYWYILLEKGLPTRPRPKLQAAHTRSASTGDNEVEEEKIIAEWIAQGRIRRSTISWCNILTKTFLDITIGNICWVAVSELLHRLVQLKTPDTFFGGFGSHVAITAGVNVFSIVPLVSLLAFIVVTAHQRIVFEDAVYFICTVFFGLFLGKVGPWLMSFESFREHYRNATLAANGTLSNNTVQTVGEL